MMLSDIFLKCNLCQATSKGHSTDQHLHFFSILNCTEYELLLFLDGHNIYW